MAEKVNPSFRDEVIIPDQYNTGAKGTLEVVDISKSYDTLNFSQSAGNYVINGYANGGCNADCYIENVLFDKGLSVTNPFKFAKVVRVHFTNCSFITVNNINGPTASKPDDDSHVEFIFENCTFNGTVSGMYMALDKCAITKTHADAVNPNYKFSITNSYIYDLTDKADSSVSIHVDGIQMAGNKTYLGGDFVFDNVRIELPKFHANVNAPYMYQVDYSDFGVANIETKNCIFNGGGYTMYLNAKGGEWEPHTVTDVRIGMCDDYGLKYPTPEPPNAVLTRVERNTALYVSSVVRDSNGIVYYVTNDDVEEHLLRVLTNLGETTMSIPANCRPSELMNASGEISVFSQLPIDIEKTLSGNIEYAVFYDDTTNEQIRFVNYTGRDVYIGEDDNSKRYSVKESTLTIIADAIRKKTSETDAIPVPNMASKIEEIPQGYLCKISRYFEEDTPCNLVTITHNIGNTNFYLDAFIDEIPDPLPTPPSTYYILSTSSCAQPQYVLSRAISASGNLSSTVQNQTVDSTTFKINMSSAHYMGGHTYTFYFYAKGDVNGLPSLDLQDKTITESGFFTPDSGYNGFSSVNVEVEQAETLPDNIHTGTVELLSNSKVLEFEHGFDVAPRWAFVIADEWGDYSILNGVQAAIPYNFSNETGAIAQIADIYCYSGTSMVTNVNNIPVNLFSIDDESVYFELNSTSSINFKPNFTYRWYAYL